MKKRLLSAILVLMVTLSLFPVSASATGTKEVHTFISRSGVDCGTATVTGLLDTGKKEFDFGDGKVANWTYLNVELGGTCTIEPSRNSKYTDIVLTSYSLEGGEYVPADYSPLPWHRLYADGQAADLAFWSEDISTIPLATSGHPAYFTFGKNTNVPCPLEFDDYCSFDLKADGTMYELDIYCYDESLQLIDGFVLPFFVKENGGSGNNTQSNFTDVKSTDYFAEAVDWAVNGHITFGTSDTTFSPNSKCTDGQILTFLWRAMGRPEPTVKSPFNGISAEKDYFYKPALWAYEKGLISGGMFDSEKPCTRSMVVTYLWKLAGGPTAPAAAFADVSSNSEYAPAVSWAVQQGITSGTSKTTFAPDGTCTRGQIVTFLYRAYGK